MELSSQLKLGGAMKYIDEDTAVEIKDSNGNSQYIDYIAVIVTTPEPVLLIQLAPF